MLDLDVRPEREVSLVELAVSHWVYLMRFAETISDTYSKLLVPLDRTEEAERVLPEAAKLLRPEGEATLLHVIQTNTEKVTAGSSKPRGIDRLDWERSEAMAYLTGLAGRVETDTNRWRCHVIEAPSVADGVISYAAREDVDIIVMYVHGRKGLAQAMFEVEPVFRTGS